MQEYHTEVHYVPNHTNKYSDPIDAGKCVWHNPNDQLWQPWHEMTSREELAVKSRKAMRVAIAMHICVEVLAEIAGKHILRGKQIE